MNTLEIRGAFIGLLAEVEDTALLQKMFEQCVEMMKGVDMLNDLPPAVIKVLAAAEKDVDITDTIPNEEAFKTFRTWPRQ